MEEQKYVWVWVPDQGPKKAFKTTNGLYAYIDALFDGYGVPAKDFDGNECIYLYKSGTQIRIGAATKLPVDPVE